MATIERAGSNVRIVWTIANDEARVLAEHLGLTAFRAVEVLRHERFERYWTRHVSVASRNAVCAGDVEHAAEVAAGYAVYSTFRCDDQVASATISVRALHDVDAAYVTLYQARRGQDVVRGALTASAPTVTLAFDARAEPKVAPSGRAEPRDREGRILAMLQGDARAASVWLALALAFVLGAVHALTPGHGKTVTAAYMLGVGGTARDALALGGVVAGSHAVSVVVLGAVAAASGSFVPAQAAPWIHLAIGAAVIALGIRLVRARAASGHDHEHRAPAGRLAVVGLVGGLIPSPEAIGIALLAFSAGRWGMGLALVLAFSAGLAVVILGIAAIAVRSRELLGRFAVARRGVALGRVAGLVFIAMGVVVAARGITAL